MTQRNLSLDLLKLIMAFMVVGLHASFLADLTETGFFLTVNGFFRLAVPVFLVINGYFFAHLSGAGRAAWFRRTLMLYLVWMLIYSYAWLDPGDLHLGALLGTVLSGYFHLWYVIAMIGGALVLTLLRRASTPALILSALLTFGAGLFAQYAGNFHLFAGTALDERLNEYWAYRNFLFFAFPFLTIGFLIHRHDLAARVSLPRAAALSALGLVLLLLESYLNFTAPARTGDIDTLAALLLLAPALFVLMMKLDWPGGGKTIGLLASGVYFLHPLALLILAQVTTVGHTALTLLTIGASTLLAYPLVRLSKRVPFLL